MSDQLRDALVRKRLLRRPAVLDRTGLKSSTLYRKVAEGKFPRPVRLGEDTNAVAWLEAEVDAWIDARIAAREVA